MKTKLPPPPDGTVLWVEVGSTVHGTALAGTDDIDETLVYVESPARVMGYLGFEPNRFERTAPGDTPSRPGDIDRNVYPLRSYVALLANGNPSMLLTLYSPDRPGAKDLPWYPSAGAEIRAVLPHLVVSRNTVRAYQGYMASQVQRIVGTKGSSHGKKGSGGRQDLIDAHGYDTKFAMHAARLGFQCIELAASGRLTLPIAEPAGGWLLDVRRGEIPFTEWWEVVLDLDSKLSALEADCPWPDKPRVEKLQEWLLSFQTRWWMKGEAPA